MLRLKISSIISILSTCNIGKLSVELAAARRIN